MATFGNVRSITRDFEHWVRTVDPTREIEMRKTIEYEFGQGSHRRIFVADPNKRGAYGGPKPPPIIIEPPTAPTGDLVGFEAGTDIANFVVTMDVTTVEAVGTLAAAEIGNDIAAIISHDITGSLARQETGADVAGFTGATIATITGSLARQETGADSAAMAGVITLGGADLLIGESDGFAADFLYATDANRVALMTSGAVAYSGLSFFNNSGGSSKWVYNSSGTLVNVAAGSLAIDYHPTTHAVRGVLGEPAATNYLFPSSLDTTNWTARGALVVTTGQTGPSGAATAMFLQSLYLPSNNDMYRFVVGLLGANARYEPSFFIKRSSTSGYLACRNAYTGAPGGSWEINLSLLGSGWERMTRSHPAVNVVNDFVSDSSGNGGIQFCTVDPVFLDLYLDFVQVELGVVSTSLIPTTTATVTRAADQIRVTPASINYSSTAGSWWVDADLNTSVSGQCLIGYTNSSMMPIAVDTATSFKLYDGAGVSKTVTSVIGQNKIAMAFANGDRALTANGLTPAINATAGLAFGSPGTNIGFGYQPGLGAQINGYLRKVYYLPRRMPDAEMQTETT